MTSWKPPDPPRQEISRSLQRAATSWAASMAAYGDDLGWTCRSVAVEREIHGSCGGNTQKWIETLVYQVYQFELVDHL